MYVIKPSACSSSPPVCFLCFFGLWCSDMVEIHFFKLIAIPAEDALVLKDTTEN